MNLLSLVTFLLQFMSLIPYITMNGDTMFTFSRNGNASINERMSSERMSLEEGGNNGEEEDMNSETGTKSWEEIMNRCDPEQGSTFSGNVSLLTRINHYEAMNGSSECPRRYKTCKTGESSIINLCSIVLDGIPSCDCSDDCYKFSSCCIDSSPLISDSFNTTINDIIELNSCQDPLTSPDIGYPFIIRSKCSPKWSNNKPSSRIGLDEIRDGCEKKNSSDYFRHVLVSSKSSHVTYLNIFCLICNFDLKEDPSNDIIFWPSTIMCDKEHPNLTQISAVSYLRDITVSSVQVTNFIMNDSDSNCTLWNHHPMNEEEEMMISLKPCYEPNVVVTTCRKNWLRSAPDYRMATLIQRLCHLIQAPVIMIRDAAIIPVSSEEVVFFQNKFCAACQDVPLSDLFCLDHFLPSRNVRQTRWQRHEPEHVVMSVRMKMNDRESTSSSFEEFCESSDMMWDPFANGCRKVFCEQSSSSSFDSFNSCSLASSSASSNSLIQRTKTETATLFCLKSSVYSIQVIFSSFFSILLPYFSWYSIS